MKWADKPYYSLDNYFKTTYHEKMYKIALDAGMTCPNRDGTLDTRGCIFCSAGGSGDFAAPRTLSIHEQIQYGQEALSKKLTGNRFVAYFQAYTNTYAPISVLRRLYTEALSEPSIVGISIATRPDCISTEVLNLLLELHNEYPNKFIWIELGLQTIHPQTASYIRRGYPLSVFDEVVASLHRIDIPIIVHVILGLPGEDNEMTLQTIQYLNQLPIWGIKLQLLHVIENTDLAVDWKNEMFTLPSKENYLELLIDCIERLRPNIVIHRLTGDGPASKTLAPLWSLHKRDVLNSFHRRMKERNTWQGKLYDNSNSNDTL